MSSAQKNIHFIRHGQTPGNQRGIYLGGRTDESLSREGIEQLLQMNYPKADLIYASPMKRCIETASLIYPSQNVICIEQFRETDFGEFEGKNYEQLKNLPSYQKWMNSNGQAKIPGGESREAFIKRCWEGFCQIMENSCDAEEIAVIVHGGTIMAILSKLLEGDFYDYQLGNGEVYSIQLKNNCKKMDSPI